MICGRSERCHRSQRRPSDNQLPLLLSHSTNIAFSAASQSSLIDPADRRRCCANELNEEEKPPAATRRRVAADLDEQISGRERERERERQRVKDEAPNTKTTRF